MSDQSGDDGDEEQRERQRNSAQHAASDLARMGIDPRSLGLDEAGTTSGAGPTAPTGPTAAPPLGPGTGPPRDRAPDRRDPSARIVPIRPEFAQDARRLGTRAPQPRGLAPPAANPGAVGVVEQLLARTAAQTPAPKAPPSRFVRALTLGMVTPDAAEAAGNERALVAAVRQRQTERRVVTFLAGKGGVGTTTVASGVGAALAALRDDHPVLLDVQAGAASLGALHGLPEPVSATVLVRSGEETLLPRTPAGLGIVDGAGWEQPLRREDLAALLDRLGADNAFNLVDAGTDPGPAAHAAIARCDQAVVVTSVGAVGLAAMQMAVSRLRQINPFAVEGAVFVVVSHHEEAHRRAHREISEQLGFAPVRVVVVPSDVSLKTGEPFDPARVAPGVREAMLRIGAAIALSGGRR